jgi:isoquinoline 1-oxidoreductase beta subunit
MNTGSTSRRNFLIAGTVVGGGLFLGIRFAENRFGKLPDSGATLQPHAFLRVAPDDTVTVIIGKAEMGQGVYTGMAMVAAEELDIDPARVKVELAGADPAFNVPFMPLQFTGGSMSTSTTYPQLREAGAKARAMLLAAAAQHWEVPVSELRTEDGKVFKGSRSLTYGQLADAATKLPVPEKVELKDPATFRYLGKPQKRLDTPMKSDVSVASMPSC